MGPTEPPDVESLSPQTRELFCEEHGVFYVKNALGSFVCQFCQREEWDG